MSNQTELTRLKAAVDAARKASQVAWAAYAAGNAVADAAWEAREAAWVAEGEK